MASPHVFLAAVPPYAWALPVLLVASAFAAFVQENAPAGRFAAWHRRPWVFALLALACVLSHRGPTLAEPAAPGAAEARLIAGALTLRDQPVFWKSVDGGPVGPLAFYAALWPCLGGEAPDTATTRLTSLLLLAGALWLAGRTLRHFADEGTVRLALLPGTVWLALTEQADFVRATDVALPVFWLALAGWLLVRAVFSAVASARADFLRWSFAGAVLALPLLARLQTASAVATLGAIALVARWRMQPSAEIRRRSALGLLAGGAAVGAALTLYLAVWGLFGQFVFSYVESNALYAAPQRLPFLDDLRQVLHGARDAAGAAEFLGGGLVPALVLGGLAVAFALPGWKQLCAAGVAWLGALATVLATGRAETASLLFLVVPTVLLTGAALVVTLECVAQRAAAWRSVIAGVFLAAVFLPQLAAHTRGGTRASEAATPLGALTAEVVRLTRPPEPIVIWGDNAGLHATAGRPQGARTATAERAIHSGPLQGAYRVRFLADLQRTPPALFIDAVGGETTPYDIAARRWAAHENWPELGAFVAGRYGFVREIAGWRFYLRNDLAARAATAAPSPESR